MATTTIILIAVFVIILIVILIGIFRAKDPKVDTVEIRSKKFENKKFTAKKLSDSTGKIVEDWDFYDKFGNEITDLILINLLFNAVCYLDLESYNSDSDVIYFDDGNTEFVGIATNTEVNSDLQEQSVIVDSINEEIVPAEEGVISDEHLGVSDEPQLSSVDPTPEVFEQKPLYADPIYESPAPSSYRDETPSYRDESPSSYSNDSSSYSSDNSSNGGGD